MKRIYVAFLFLAFFSQKSFSQFNTCKGTVTWSQIPAHTANIQIGEGVAGTRVVVCIDFNAIGTAGCMGIDEAVMVKNNAGTVVKYFTANSLSGECFTLTTTDGFARLSRWCSSAGSDAVISWYTLDACNRNTCEGTLPPILTMSTGNTTTCATTFTDPGGCSANYSNNQNSTRTFCPATANSCIAIRFNSFALESSTGCANDFLRFYDGNSTAAPVIGTFCGTTSPGVIKPSNANTSGCITVQFVSNGATVAAGWNADVYCTTCPAFCPTDPCPSGTSCNTTTNNCVPTCNTSGTVVPPNDAIANAELITDCGTSFYTCNYGAGITGNCGGDKAMGTFFYNDLDCNTATGNAAGGDVTYSVENDIYYKFCPTATGAWTLTIEPSQCVGPTGLATTNGYQYAVFSGTTTNLTKISGGISGTNYTGPVTVNFTVSSTSTCYFIQIDGFGGTQCVFAVNVGPVDPGAGCALAVPGATICSGNTATLTATGSGGTFKWYTAQTGGTLLFTGNPYTTPALTTTTSYWVSETKAGVESARTEVKVTVLPNPTPNITPDPATVCAGANLQLNGNPSGGSGTYSGHLWSGAGSTSLSSTSIVNPVFNNSTTGTYKVVYQVTDSKGCIGKDSVNITVNKDNPAFNYASSTYCRTGADPQATITGGSTGTFSATPAGIVFLNTSTGLIDLSASSVNTYTIKFVTSGTCKDSATFNVTITDAPKAGFSYSGPYCKNGTPNPSPTFVAGASAGTFSATPAGLIFVSTSTGQINLTTSTAGTYKVYNTIPAAGGCSSALDSANVTINPQPIAAITPDPASTCAGVNLAMNGNPSGGSGTFPTHLWTGAGATSLTATNVVNPTFNNATAGSYFLTYRVTDNNNCSNTDTITVTVNPNPIASITPDPAFVCAGVNLAMNGNPAGGSGTYSTHAWSGAGSTSLSATNVVNPNFNNSTAGTYALTYTVTDSKGCIGSDGNTVTVTANPTASITPDPATVCAGSDLAMNGNPVGGSGTYSHTWTGAGSSSLSATNVVNPTFNNSTAGTYALTYTVTDDNGCVGTDNITVTVSPVATVTPGGPDNICSSATPVALALSGASVGGGATTGAWSITSGGGTLSSTAQTATPATVTYTPAANFSGTVTLTLTTNDPAGPCPAVSATRTITIDPAATVTPGATLTVCQSATPSAIALSGAIVGGSATTGAWSITSGGGTLSSTAQTATPATVTYTPAANFAGSVTLTLTTNDPAGPCPAVSATRTVTIDPAATVTPGATLTACQSATPSAITLSGASVGGGATTGAWSITSGGGTLSSTAQTATPATITYTPAANFTGSVILTLTTNDPVGACPAVSATRTITVNPAATVTPGGPNNVCQSATPGAIALSGASIGGGATTGAWSITSGGGTLSSTAQTATPATVTYTPAANFSGTVTLTLITNDPAGSCNAVSGTRTITIDPASTVTPGGPNTICESATPSAITLSGASVGGGANTGAWSITSGGGTLSSTALTATPATVTYTPAANFSGTVTLTLTTNDPTGACPAVSGTRTITVTAADDPSFSYGTSTFCSTSPTNPVPTSIALAGGTFASNTGLSINATTGEINLAASGLSSPTDSVTYTTTGTCPRSLTIAVTITSGFNADFSYSSSAYCSQEVPNPTPVFTTGSAGTFSSTAGLVISTSGEIDLVTSTPGTYTVNNDIAGSGGCAAANHSVQVTIKALPNASFSGLSSAYCVDTASTTLTPAVTGGTFTGNGTTSNTFDASAAGVGGHTIKYIVTVNGCTDSTSQTTTVNALPDSSFTGLAASYCVDASAVTLTPATTGGAFSGTGISGSTFDPAVAGAGGPYTITYTVTDANVCTNSSSQDVTVTPLDDDGFTYGATSFCKTGTNPTPTVNTAGGSFAGSAGLSINTTSGEIDLSATALGSYNVTYTTAGTCPNDSTITVTITNAPTAGFAFSASYCKDEANPFPTMNTGATKGVFTSTPASLTFVDANTGEIDLGASAAGTYTIYNTIAASGGCAEVKDSVTVSINALPIAFNVTPVAGSYCPGGSGVTVGLDNSESGVNYQLMSGASAIGSPVSGTGAAISFGNQLIGNYIVIATNATTGCISTMPGSAVITLNNVLTISASATDASCGINDGTITVSGNGVLPYTYSLNGGTSAPDSVFTGLAGGVYSIVIQDAGSCTGSITVTVGQAGGPDAAFTATPTSGMAPLTVSLINNSTNATSYEWHIMDDVMVKATSKDTSYLFQKQGTYTIKLLAYNSSCVDSSTITIEVIGASVIVIPNVFTPNGDGVNDVFKMKATNIAEFRGAIYNRWGKKLFEWDDVTKGWDGTSPSGEAMPEGTYYYLIRSVGEDGVVLESNRPFNLFR